MRSRILRLLPALAWLVAILVVSSLPLRGPELPLAHLDKLAHLAEYGVLAVLALVGLDPGSTRGLFLRTLAAVPIMALVAAADELHQRWIPGRSGDPLDLGADVLGILLGAGLVLAMVWARGRRGDG